MPVDREVDEVLRVEGLRKSFGAQEILRGIDLSIRRGETAVIIGASGSGKSTLLRCINLLELPTAGRIWLNGSAVGTASSGGAGAGGAIRFSDAELRQVRVNVGMVFQQFNLFPHMTVLQNVMEGQVTSLRRPKAQAEEKARLLLSKVGLSEKVHEYPARLSGGQQQRVAISRALAMDPQVMLFDEVTSALDPELVAEVLLVMRALREDGMTMLIVTHELGFAYHIAHRVIYLHEGEIHEQGPPDQVLVRPERERTRQFLEGHVQFRLPEARQDAGAVPGQASHKGG